MRCDFVACVTLFHSYGYFFHVLHSILRCLFSLEHHELHQTLTNGAHYGPHNRRCSKWQIFSLIYPKKPSQRLTSFKWLSANSALHERRQTCCTATSSRRQRRHDCHRPRHSNKRIWEIIWKNQSLLHVGVQVGRWWARKALAAVATFFLFSWANTKRSTRTKDLRHKRRRAVCEWTAERLKWSGGISRRLVVIRQKWK